MCWYFSVAKCNFIFILCVRFICSTSCASPQLWRREQYRLCPTVLTHCAASRNLTSFKVQYHHCRYFLKRLNTATNIRTYIRHSPAFVPSATVAELLKIKEVRRVIVGALVSCTSAASCKRALIMVRFRTCFVVHTRSDKWENNLNPTFPFLSWERKYLRTSYIQWTCTCISCDVYASIMYTSHPCLTSQNWMCMFALEKCCTTIIYINYIEWNVFNFNIGILFVLMRIFGNIWHKLLKSRRHLSM